MRIAVSRCLLGEPCRYDGVSKPHDAVRELAEREDVELVGVCPEVAGGLPTPRPPAELCDGRAMTADGSDVTDAYLRGASIECARAIEAGVELAILKERSPSCGARFVYDGTHSGKLVEGEGVFARMLAERGVEVMDEDEWAATSHLKSGRSTPRI